MDTIDAKWAIMGVATIASIASLPFIVSDLSPLTPMPWHILILANEFSYGSIVVMPVIYLVVLILLRNRENFGDIILLVALLLSFLNGLYFWNWWESGVVYQGELHTKIVFFENVAGCFVLVLLAYLSKSMKSKVLQSYANLFLFLLLSWCIFPYLGGELT